MNSMQKGLAGLALSLLTVGAAHADQWSAPSLARESRHGDLDSIERDPNIGVYIGLGYGQSTSYNHNIDSTTRHSAFKIFAGYAYNKHLATELAYLDIGEDNGYGMSSVRVSSHSYVGSVVGRLPLGDYLSVMGKLGVAAYDTKEKVSNSADDTRTKGDFALGVVLALDLGQHFAIRAEYEAIGSANTIATISGVFKF